jgi:predicted metal-binding membrane protein
VTADAAALPRRYAAGAALRRRPALVAELVAVFAWLLLLELHAGPSHHAAAGSLHAHLHAVPAVDAARAASAPGAVAAGLPGWVVMVAAMMVPSAVPAARHVGRASLRRRRNRAVAEFLAAYLGIWAVAGAVLLATVSRWASGRWTVPAALGVAAAWQVTPYHRRYAAACHRRWPLPPTGRAAVRGTARYGLRYGLACLGACWPLMVVMAVATRGHLVWTVALGAGLSAERLLPRPRRTARAVGAVLAVAAAGAATAAAMS